MSDRFRILDDLQGAKNAHKSVSAMDLPLIARDVRSYKSRDVVLWITLAWAVPIIVFIWLMF